MPDGEVVPLGPLQKRSQRIISKASLWDHVELVSKKVDQLTDKLDLIDGKLDTIMEILGHGIRKEK